MITIGSMVKDLDGKVGKVIKLEIINTQNPSIYAHVKYRDGYEEVRLIGNLKRVSFVYEATQYRNNHIESIIDYLVEIGTKVPNLYEVSDEEFENLKQEADKYFIRKVMEK